MKARLGQLYIQGDQKVLEESRLELAKEYKQMELESYEQYLQGKDFSCFGQTTVRDFVEIRSGIRRPF